MQLICKHFRDLTLPQLYAIMKLRVDVFVVEQKIICSELDDKDQDAWHVFLQDEDGVVAYARVLDKGVAFADVAIGRVVCVKRRQGYAQRVLRACIEVAKREYSATTICLHAQTYAVGLYQKVGFTVVSDKFEEDGIPHVEMLLTL